MIMQITQPFEKDFNSAVKELSYMIIGGRIINRTILSKKITKKLTPIIYDMFTTGQVASNKVVKSGVAKLVTQYNVPYKYNKSLFEHMNEHSIFAGYYDKNYKDIFTKTEINRIKKVILTAKYSGWNETKTIQQVRQATNFTVKKARLLARNEKARLQTVAKSLYFNKKEVRNKYNMVWHNSGTNIRPDHAAMAGKVADKDGMFHSKDGLIPGPPYIFSPYNCKCYVTLETK